MLYAQTVLSKSLITHIHQYALYFHLLIKAYTELLFPFTVNVTVN